MKSPITISFLAVFISVLSLRAETPSTNSVVSNITATVQLVDQSTHRSERDLAGVAVWLVPLNGQSAPRPGSAHYRMLQHDKHFEPHLLVVPVGTAVEFPNLDPWFHNVFSMYRGKRFDLGLYQAGEKKMVRFDRPGPSYIFCNIHPEMTAVVLAVNSNFIGISDSAGHVVINDVPPGEYQLKVWHERAAASSLAALQKKIVVSENAHSLGVLAIGIEKHQTEAHKNKYGHDYDSKTLDPQY